MEAQLVACVKESLDAFLYDNAKFMCERLWAESNTEENMLLLATVYIRADQAYRAYHLLSGSQALSPSGLSMPGRYLLAQCCHKLGKFDEAKGALAAGGKGEVPGGAAGYYLLGKLHSLTDNPSMAISCYHAALTQDPLLWAAYEGLCQLGHDEDASTIVSQAEFALSDRQQAGTDGSAQDTTMQTPATSLSADAPAFAPSPHAPRQWSFRSSGGGQEGLQDDAMMATEGPFLTPPAVTGPVQMPAAVRRGGQAGPRETPALTPIFRGGVRSSGAGFNSDRLKFLDEGKMRKVSNRLFADAHSSGRGSPFVTTRRGSRGGGGPAAFSADDLCIDTGGAPLFTFKAGQGARLGLGGASDLANGHRAEGEKSREGVRSVLGLVQQLGEGYGLLCRYQCQEAVAAFDRLDNSQYQTAWVMCQIGRACYEEVDFHQAAFAFQRAQQLDPCRLEGMEYFSTVLWHLKREVDLSHLAQEAVALDRLDPRAWCIMGNCFSLQKDHEAALKFFQRSLQLEPSFTYAYTLAGHENLAMEQFDKSLACYRNAMRLDPRHYNAWYGVGQIYYRQEKFEMAAYHFESSLKINSRSSVLRCYVGMVMAKLDRLDEAAAMLRRAIESDPNNPLARFELANVLVSTDNPTRARRELEILKDMAPREASVYFQLGKIERRLDNTEKALLYFSTALDLKPSSADVNLIKSAIEKLRISNDSEEEEV